MDSKREAGATRAEEARIAKELAIRIDIFVRTEEEEVMKDTDGRGERVVVCRANDQMSNRFTGT